MQVVPERRRSMSPMIKKNPSPPVTKTAAKRGSITPQPRRVQAQQSAQPRTQTPTRLTPLQQRQLLQQKQQEQRELKQRQQEAEEQERARKQQALIQQQAQLMEEENHRLTSSLSEVRV